MSTEPNIEVKRSYDPRMPADGRRILVDRIWPRGFTKDTADLDEWCRDVAPSTALRQSYGHCATRFGEFRDHYLTELDDPAHAESVARLHALSDATKLTLVTATRHLAISHARVLAERLTLGVTPSTIRGRSTSTSTRPRGLTNEWTGRHRP
jgi:uncharacterized protein YeaO (DUF488 family)